MIRRYLLLAVAAVVAAVAASAQTRSQGTTYAAIDAPPEFHAAIARGDLVIVSIHSALLVELRKALSAHGPAGALNACHLDATGAAYKVARKEGLAAGRTSVRLRSPTNAPRPWAAEIVAKHTGKRTADLDGFVVDLGDRIGLLRPIVEQPVCRSCHGPSNKIDPQVRAVLADRYPRDRAMDFEDGDIRGWYWVEVPKR